jgi:dipeptidyl-peptidase 4
MKLLIVASFLFYLLPALGQKELTLEESVLGQYRQFYPEHIFGFAWISNSTDYSYLDGYVNLKKGSLNSTEEKTILTIADVNVALGTQLYYFQNFKWKSGTEFYVGDEQNYYLFNLDTKNGSTIKLDLGAANADLDVNSGRIAYTVDNNLFMADSKSSHSVTNNTNIEIVSGQAIARSEMGITKGTFWSNSGEYLAFYQKDESNVHDYPLLDIDAYPGALKSIKYPMAGQGSEKAKVGIYNVKKKKVVYISPRTGDESYLTNVSWSKNDEFITIAEVNRDQKHMWLQLYTNTGKFVRTLFEEKSDTWVEPENAALFLNNENDIVWVSERDGFNNLYLYNINGELKQKITSNKFMMKEVLHQFDDVLYFSATGENPLNTLIYKVDLKGNQELISKEEGTHTAVFHPSEDVLFNQFSASTIPNVARIISTDGKSIATLKTAKNPYEDVKIGSSEVKAIKAKDGTDLYTQLIKPSNFDPSKKYPVLVYVYGGPHAQLITNSWLYGASLWMYWMAEQGYLVFTLDNRGSAERGVDFEHAVHRQLGTLELEDQMTGVDYLKSLPYVDEKRLAVHGWSFGGFMTGTMMMRTPGVFTTGVAGGPVTDWKFYEVMYGERYMDTPKQNPEGYNKASLLNYVDDLEGKLLLIHGAIDNTVVMQHNLALVQAFIKKGKQVDFFPYPMHEHNVSGKDRVHLMEKVLMYVLENNK